VCLGGEDLLLDLLDLDLLLDLVLDLLLVLLLEGVKFRSFRLFPRDTCLLFLSLRFTGDLLGDLVRDLDLDLLLETGDLDLDLDLETCCLLLSFLLGGVEDLRLLLTGLFDLDGDLLLILGGERDLDLDSLDIDLESDLEDMVWCGVL